MRETKINSFETEWTDTLHSLREMNVTYTELKYFLHLAESIVPRDTDSAVKSVLGMLTNEELHLADDSIILLPLTGDSMRKIPDMLKNTMKIIPYEIPSDQENPLQKKRFQEEILRVTFEVEKHLKRYLSKKALLEQWRLSERAAASWAQFHQLCTSSTASVSGSAKLLIANSYHWCENKTEWIEHLDKLNKEIISHKKIVSPEMAHLHVMLLGSPIYAPNYKVPFLVEEMGLELYSIIHPDILHLTSAAPFTGNRNTVIRELANQYLAADMSSAFINNQTLSDSVQKALAQGNIHGIIVHILKGQIEYDFELNRLEKLIEQYHIPVFRLETDYNYQDVEQLRIRLEAFAEMLQHRSVLKHVEVSDVKKAI